MAFRSALRMRSSKGLVMTMSLRMDSRDDCLRRKCIFFVLLVLSFQGTAAVAHDQGLPSVRFQDCYDGDTCTTIDAEKVRVACINAPEINSRPRLRATRMRPTAYGNTSAERSTENLRSLVLGRWVAIRRLSVDRYGRTVAELFSEDKNVGQQQVIDGHAVLSPQHASQCEWASRL